MTSPVYGRPPRGAVGRAWQRGGRRGRRPSARPCRRGDRRHVSRRAHGHRLTAQARELVRKLVLVDVLPGIKAQRARHITDFVNGPATFASLDDLLERTARFNPARSRSSLRRGILHNAEQQPDGTWVWRWVQVHISGRRRWRCPGRYSPQLLPFALTCSCSSGGGQLHHSSSRAATAASTPAPM